LETADRPKAVYQLRPTWQKPEELVRMCLTGSVPIGGDPVAEWVEYRIALPCDGTVKPTTLVLEPTAIRGRGTIRAGGKEWPFAIADTIPSRSGSTCVRRAGQRESRAGCSGSTTRCRSTGSNGAVVLAGS